MKRNLIFSVLTILGVMLVASISFARTPTTGSLDEAAKRASQLRAYREAKKKKKSATATGSTATENNIKYSPTNPPPKYPDAEPLSESRPAPQNTANNSQATQSPYKLSLGTSISYEQKVEEKENGVRDRGMGLMLMPKFVFWDFSLRADFFYGYDLNQPRIASGWGDGIISLMYDGLKLSALKFSPYTSVELPLSKESRENREIILVNNLGVLTALDTKALDMENLSLSYSVAFGYYTNEYTTRVNGEPATEYKIVQTFKTGYKFSPFSVNFKFQFTSAYSYEDVVRDGFLHSESISYVINEGLGFSLYHYNKAPFLKDVTYQNNLKAFDEKTSTVGLSMDLNF